MNWLKRIFKKKQKEETSALKEKNMPKYSIKIYSKCQYSGLDYNFINLIYFKSPNDKEKYINDLIYLLDLLEINNNTDIVSAKSKIVEASSNQDLTFVFESLLFTETTYQEIDNGEIITIMQRITEEGINKLKNYYSALSFGCFNIKRKLENNEHDWSFELNLIDSALEDSKLYNSARIETLAFLTIAFDKINEIEKSEFYFSKIKEGNFNLAPDTITKFYSKIADHFKSQGKLNKVIECYENGLKVNPKYGIKRELERLKKTL